MTSSVKFIVFWGNDAFCDSFPHSGNEHFLFWGQGRSKRFNPSLPLFFPHNLFRLPPTAECGMKRRSRNFSHPRELSFHKSSIFLQRRGIPLHSRVRAFDAKSFSSISDESKSHSFHLQSFSESIEKVSLKFCQKRLSAMSGSMSMQ